ncbi:AhpC/TSA family protein [Pedobacter sp. MC2016-14]|uniref:TlpA disulfide reductase family protein n=1 Tax=Pedobacter sp. MC2016-14 TaxID=2897327 RepID=UPI001E415248|nr:TlpA disulfide reductase family protein [Pedobacter sp. MC2016-14]MCD0490200.1 AhpC/TSA family protein [Pedobacter sp. MC2016-14]
MKKMMLSALALAPLLGCAQSSDFNLMGKVNPLNVPTKAYLVYRLEGKQVIDSAVVTNGAFQFKGVSEGPLQAQLLLDHAGKGISTLGRTADVKALYLEPGTVTLTATDSVKKAKITGSKINAEFDKYSALLTGPEKAMAALNAEYASAPEDKKKDNAFRSDLQQRFEKFASEREAIQNTYIKQNPNSYFSLEALTESAGNGIDVEKVEPVFKSLSPAVRASKAGVSFAKAIEAARNTSVGAIAPDFTQNDVNDKPVKLSDFKGKYVLIDFWASWCGPCRAENPNVVKAYNEYKDKNFTVLGVSLDQPGKKDAWLGAIAADGLTWTQVSDLKFWNNAVAKQYGINSIPQNFLVDPSGKIVGKNLRGADLTKKLEELLAAKGK